MLLVIKQRKIKKWPENLPSEEGKLQDFRNIGDITVFVICGSPIEYKETKKGVGVHDS